MWWALVGKEAVFPAKPALWPHTASLLVGKMTMRCQSRQSNRIAFSMTIHKFDMPALKAVALQ
jgi:hypothetical protein